MISDIAMSYLKLSLYPRVGLKTAHDLLRAYGSIAPALKSLKANSDWEKNFEEELKLIAEHHLHIVGLEDELYPPQLKAIPEAPLVLYIKGSLEALNHDGVAVVGTRYPSAHARQQAYRLGEDLALAGLSTISGLAVGIDGAAHQGSLAGGGPTVAVLGCGLGLIYPEEHTELAQHIVQHGCLVSEFAVNSMPTRGTFPRRNRIISGLSARGVIMVEGAKKSGSLITAEYAKSHGRAVYAMPGLSGQAQTAGNHMLLKQGAHFLEKASDLLNFPGVFAASSGTPPSAKAPVLSADELWLWDALSSVPCSLDPLQQLGQKKGLTFVKLMTILSRLELRGLIRQLPGKKFVRVE